MGIATAKDFLLLMLFENGVVLKGYFLKSQCHDISGGFEPVCSAEFPLIVTDRDFVTEERVRFRDRPANFPRVTLFCPEIGLPGAPAVQRQIKQMLCRIPIRTRNDSTKIFIKKVRHGSSNVGLHELGGHF